MLCNINYDQQFGRMKAARHGMFNRQVATILAQYIFSLGEPMLCLSPIFSKMQKFLWTFRPKGLVRFLHLSRRLLLRQDLIQMLITSC